MGRGKPEQGITKKISEYLFNLGQDFKVIPPIGTIQISPEKKPVNER